MKLIKYGLPLISALALGFGVTTTIKLNPKAEVAQPVYQPSEPNPTSPRLYGLDIIEPRGGSVSVSSPLSGTVSEGNVVTGQRILKGEPLFSLDNQEIADEVKIRQSTLDAKRAELDRVKAGSHPDEIRAAEKRLEAMKVSVDRAKDAFDRARGLVEQDAIIAKGIATAGLLAHIVTCKYVDALPFPDALSISHQPERLVSRMSMRPSSRVLERGSGPGYFSPEFARAIPEGKLVLADVQQEMLDMAR